MSILFEDRREAGRALAKALSSHRGEPNTLVIGLPRGGVVVAAEVAKELKIPLDILSPRKIGAPFNPELAVGAITEDGKPLFNSEILYTLGLRPDALQATIQMEMKKIKERLLLYRKGLPKRVLKGKRLIIVDDGLATGYTMKAAILQAQEEGAKEIIVAVPVSPEETLQEIKALQVEVLSLAVPPHFQAVGQFYNQFYETSDDEVIRCLHDANLITPLM